jgi:hypothetical protein
MIELPETVKLGDSLTDLVEPIREALEAAEDNIAKIEAEEAEFREKIRERKDEQRREIAGMRRALTLLDPNYTPPSAKKRKPKAQSPHVGVTRSNGTATGYGISAEQGGDFAKKILELTNDGETWTTQKDVYEALGSDQTRASAAFLFLREIEFLRKGGRDPESRRERWFVMDKTAYERYMKDVVANQQTTEEKINNG